jgi:hypothetical protein
VGESRTLEEGGGENWVAREAEIMFFTQIIANMLLWGYSMELEYWLG